MRGIRLKGQVTVYAALSLGLVLALIVNCVKSCKLVIADTEINMATRLSVESVFAVKFCQKLYLQGIIMHFWKNLIYLQSVTNSAVTASLIIMQAGIWSWHQSGICWSIRGAVLITGYI